MLIRRRRGGVGGGGKRGRVGKGEWGGMSRGEERLCGSAANPKK